MNRNKHHTTATKTDGWLFSKRLVLPCPTSLLKSCWDRWLYRFFFLERWVHSWSWTNVGLCVPMVVELRRGILTFQTAQHHGGKGRRLVEVVEGQRVGRCSPLPFYNIFLFSNSCSKQWREGREMEYRGKRERRKEMGERGRDGIRRGSYDLFMENSQGLFWSCATDLLLRGNKGGEGCGGSTETLTRHIFLLHVCAYMGNWHYLTFTNRIKT